MRIVVPLIVNRGPDGKPTVGIPEPDIFWLSEDRSYLLFRDPRRRFRAFKDVIFNVLGAQCRRMEVKYGKTYSKGYLFVRKNLYTLLEMFAN
jgi:hypothetical protein